MARLRRRVFGVVFDLDGTLTTPGSLDLAVLRRRCGIPAGADILAYMDAVVDPRERENLVERVHAEELAALNTVELREHCRTVLKELDRIGMRRALHTRNNEHAMHHTLRLIDDSRPYAGFSVALSRSFTPTKPHPDGLLHIARAWQCHPTELVMVGDSIDDMLAGRRAGATTVLLQHDLPHFTAAREHADHIVASLHDILSLVCIEPS